MNSFIEILCVVTQLLQDVCFCFKKFGRSAFCLFLMSKLWSLMAVFNLFSVFTYVLSIFCSVTWSMYRVNFDPFRYSLKLSMPQAAAAISSRSEV